MKKIILLTLFASFLKISSGQITQHNWMIGGTGLFTSTTSNSLAGNAGLKQTQIDITPNIGYFPFDKVAGGLKLAYSNTRYKQLNNPNYNLGKYNAYGIGPFVRYYLLSTEKGYNVIIDGSYEYEVEKAGGVASDNPTPVEFPLTKYQIQTLSIGGGPVIYFNSCVGLEFLAEYSTSKYVNYAGRNNRFQVGIGLQVHLEKDN